MSATFFPARASRGCTNRASTTSCPPSGVGRRCCATPEEKPDVRTTGRNATWNRVWKRLYTYAQRGLVRGVGGDEGMHAPRGSGRCDPFGERKQRLHVCNEGMSSQE